MVRIATVWFGFNVVPRHVFLATGEGPGGFAGHCACLAPDAAVQIENKSKLLLRIGRIIRVIHFAAELPVKDGAHTEGSFIIDGIGAIILMRPV